LAVEHRAPKTRIPRIAMTNRARARFLTLAAAMAVLSVPFAAAAQNAPAATSPGAGPVIVVETVKGTFEFETYPNEAPKTVARIVELVNKRFYNGQRVHRVEKNFVVQFGDPTTRDMTKERDWGRMGSGTPIGVAEMTKTRTHVAGAVAMAHAGDASKADSQMYVTLSPQPSLDGKYTVFGKVISGMDVVGKLAVTDRIIRITVREAK
jgi:cyclophilin family peptidyl-prolyl cis-trans isomerase